ncbi:oxidoreductase [Portibacter lacus]|uniref:Short-chain dehydrogenase n=1 Tax=Portibacter lacus TaxID=1099794 RepID=A0AA37SKL6_9BACT|nr:oxidoreductase [Portibacter lacus]GLR15617.1 short-chain dehydrogenase [Portibacter lacus]
MFRLSEMPDQKGKIAIVTGANIGLGYETAKALAMKGAKVIMACRNRDKADSAMKAILNEWPDADLEFISLDLSSKKSIKSFADSYKAKYSNLDLLINNAGIMIPPYRETEDGFESQWGVNYLGHFYLTGMLMETIENSDHGRVVTLSSLAHINGKINFDNPNMKDSYKPMVSYRQSKLACLIFAFELQRRLEAKDSKVISVGVHPGVALTNLFAAGPKWMRLIAPLFKGMFNTVEGGAKPSIMGAIDPTMKGGEYLGPTGKRGMKGEPGIVESNEISKDKAVGDKLWTLSENLLDYKFDV